MNNKIDDILIGIDFGTTNTVVTHFINNKAIVLCDSIFKTIPSKIAKLNGKIYCGNYIPVNCSDQIHSWKTTIGSNLKYKFNCDEQEYSQMDLLIIFFNHIYELITKNLNICGHVIKAVITVPSNFNDVQREIIKSAFIASKINVLRIINEPSAAALAYGLSQSSTTEEQILVIDTGGGTMDFTILQKDELFFEVIHSEGLNDLGGNNFTQLIMDDIMRINNLDMKSTNKNILWNQAQKMKEKLTYLKSYDISLKLTSDDKIINYNLSRIKFENLSGELIKKVEFVLKNIIENYSNINYIILVGGTSRIPLLQETIKKITNKKPWIHPDLESVVSEGAGLYAGIIENKFTTNEDVVLLDVLPLSLGVELADGSYSIIIPKNTPLPIKRSQKYTTDSPGETSIKVNVYQGERKIANKNFLIGEFVFDKVSAGGVPIIEIAFKVDLNTIINIGIVDRKSGVEKNIIIKDIPKIDFEELEKIIMTSVKLNDADETELLRSQNIYLIKTHIENALINLQINDLIDEDSKQDMLNKFKIIDDTLETMNNFQLIETIAHLQEKYSILGTLNDGCDSNETGLDSVEQLFLNDKKIELSHKIDILLARNPEWKEFLDPVLEELSYSSVTIEYINEKLTLLEELENSTETNDLKNYKQEVNNLCLYLKNEIELGNINLGDQTCVLTQLINENFDLLIQQEISIDWKTQLDFLNKKCEELYSS
jgi:molecular chaperone DnaK